MEVSKDMPLRPIESWKKLRAQQPQEWVIRTDEQLAAQNRGLIEVAETLEALQVPYFLSDGTLLGAIREKNFIRWDWDVGITVRQEDLATSIHKIRDLLGKKGFAVDPKLISEHKVNARKYGTKYEIAGYELKGTMRVRGGWRLPDKFFSEPGTVEFLGRQYPCPQPPEEYLAYLYGNWQVPKMSKMTHARLSQTVLFRTKTKIFYGLMWLKSRFKIGKLE